MTKFTIHCFIRKNTPELRKKLEELGYNNMFYKPDDEIVCTRDNDYYTAREFETEDLLRCRYIDCGINEHLFLVLAALHSKEIKKYATLALNEWCTKNDQIIEPWHDAIQDLQHIAIEIIQQLSRDYCIVSREFVKRLRLIIELDKKQMLEKPIGEKIALA